MSYFFVNPQIDFSAHLTPFNPLIFHQNHLISNKKM